MSVITFPERPAIVSLITSYGSLVLVGPSTGSVGNVTDYLPDNIDDLELIGQKSAWPRPAQRQVVTHERYGFVPEGGRVGLWVAFDGTKYIGADWYLDGYGTQYAVLPASECYVELIEV